MKKFVSISLVALALTAGCRDEQERPNAAPATVAERITAPSYSASGNGERSSVCVALDEELAAFKAALTQDPSNADAQDAVAASEARLAAFCK